jgi:uracil-DNA glycosylase family 4
MEELKAEFLDILAQVRTHLEYLKTLGVTHIEMPSGQAPAGFVADTTAGAKQAGKSAPVAKKHGPAAVRPVPAKPQGLEDVRQDAAACAGCELGKGRKTVVFGEGSPRADVLFVGGAPGAEDEKQARPFVDAAGQLLTDIIVKGMQLRREDTYITTAVKCRAPEGRGPEPEDVEACSRFLARQVDAIKPKVIIALGGAAAHALLGQGQDIAALRGRWHDYRGVPVMPTFEPAQLLANPGNKKAVWEDIKKVLAELKKIKK